MRFEQHIVAVAYGQKSQLFLISTLNLAAAPVNVFLFKKLKTKRQEEGSQDGKTGGEQGEYEGSVEGIEEASLV